MSSVANFYNTVINELIESFKPIANECGLDPAALMDLKEAWNRNIKDSGALEPLKPTIVQSAAHFSSVMQQQQQQQQSHRQLEAAASQRGGGGARLVTSVGNASSRLIKPSGQGEQNCFTGGMGVVTGLNTTAARVPVPVLVQPANPAGFRPVPVVINGASQHGLAVFSQYHNIIDPSQLGAQIVTDNGLINLRKNQVDGADDTSSDGEFDEESEFVNVSEADPLSVRPPLSNIPGTPLILKKENQDADSEDLIEEEMENLNNADLSIKEEESEEDEGEDDDVAQEENEEEPLNSGDDISDDDPERIFETENVIVCQYEKVNRTRNKWKLNLSSGIANLHGRDYLFHKAIGEAEW